jgi:hypothetical protein
VTGAAGLLLIADAGGDETARPSRPVAGLDAGAACRRGGIEGLAADRTTGGGTARRGARNVGGIERLAGERIAGLAGFDAGAARHRGGASIAPEAVASGGMIDAPRLALRPLVRRIGIDEWACGWQVYPE